MDSAIDSYQPTDQPISVDYIVLHDHVKNIRISRIADNLELEDIEVFKDSFYWFVYLTGRRVRVGGAGN